MNDECRKARKVMTLRPEYEGSKLTWVNDEIGEFIQYGMSIIEHESGASSYTSAIVEMADGRVLNLPLHQIRFVAD